MDVFPNAPLKSYEELRKEIKSGDILLCSGNSVFSNMIKQVTQSVWSHVAFIIRLEVINRIMVLESVESIGVRTVPLSNYVNNYNSSGIGYPGQLLIARHQDLQQGNIKHLSKTAIDLLGCPYGTEEIVRIATRIGMGSFGMPNTSIDIPNGKDFICSEYAYVCFKSVGVEIPFNTLGFISPADFARCERVKPIAYLTNTKIEVSQKSSVNLATVLQ